MWKEKTYDSVVLQSNDDPQSLMDDAKAKAIDLMTDPGSDAQSLQRTITFLTPLLDQMQKINPSNLPPDMKDSLNRLIILIEDDIAKLKSMIDSLSRGACVFKRQIVDNGASIIAYESESVGAGQSCKQQIRVCTNGQLSGSYDITSCNVERGPLTATYSPSLVRYGDNVTITPRGGRPPYTYMLSAGAGNLNRNIYKAPMTAEVAEVLVSDSDKAVVKVEIQVVPRRVVQRFFVGSDATATHLYSDYMFVVPNYTKITVKLWGAGGTDVFCFYASGGSGASTFLNLTAGAPTYNTPGVAKGGDVNIVGNQGSFVQGGSAPNGGKGGVNGTDAEVPGGGGLVSASGSYVEKTYMPGELPIGSLISFQVGASIWEPGPLGSVCIGREGFKGASGAVEIAWE